jgi:hypothetical protein
MAITLDGLNLGIIGSGGPPGVSAVHVTGDSSDVTVSRSLVQGHYGGVQIDSGGSGDVVSTNVIYGTTSGVWVDGATRVDVTGNTIYGVSADPDYTATEAVSLTDGSTGTSVENNVLAYPGSASPATATVAVDSTSVPARAVDYNVVFPFQYDDDSGAYPLQSAYSWAGVDYGNATAFFQGTGQGKHDLTADPKLTFGNSNDASAYAKAPQTNSANSAAPGALTTDIYGEPCEGDPLEPVTGAGSPAYCARGAVQPQYTDNVEATVAASGALSATVQALMTQQISVGSQTQTTTPLLTQAVSYEVNWGDGTTSGPVQGSATDTATDIPPHTYAKRGTYTVTVTADLTNGTQTPATSSVTTMGTGFTAFGPQRIVDSRTGVGGIQGKLSPGCYALVGGFEASLANSTAITANLTVTDTTGAGWVSVASGSQVSNLQGRVVSDWHRLSRPTRC